MDERNTNVKSSDLRTFLIALLTAVIVVALYHFGMGFCKMFCPEKSCGSYRPVQRYMLVPVMEPPYGYPGACGWKKPGCGPKYDGGACDKKLQTSPSPTEKSAEEVSPKQ